MLYLSLFGPPGAGKGTQAKKIAGKYRLYHLSTGDILRAEIANGSTLGHLAAGIINRGELLSDDVVMALVEHAIETSVDVDGFLLDGFPRTVAQARMLDAYLTACGKQGLDALLSIEVDREELTRRMLKRAAVEGRVDDTEEVIRNRFAEYEMKTRQVADYYREQGKCLPVDGNNNVETVFQDLVAMIDEVKRQESLLEK
ncbi:MAG: adenylate kinase [Odoribacteraceae bacterium]|jgi:adenylate kinase|nr:adenylate kinase [Odoribacteraceae bacterium]